MPRLKTLIGLKMEITYVITTMNTMKPRPSQTFCVSLNRSLPNSGTTKSLVNMLPTQTNCESSELMIAASTPAENSPINTGLTMNFFTIMLNTALALSAPLGSFGTIKLPSAYRPAPHMPIRMHGTQTIMMQSGWAMTVSRNAFALLAVSQCWNRCGNIPTLNGTSM